MKKKIFAVGLVLLVLITFLFYSCGKSGKVVEIVNDDNTSLEAAPAESGQDLNERKLVKDIFLELQTTQFDKCMETIRSGTSEQGGYIQNSDIMGNAYDYDAYRYASLVLRIPADKTAPFLNSLSGAGTVTSQQENIRDVTMEYIDVESRLKALRAEEESLLALLKRADSVNSIITVQSRLSEVRGQIESYEGQMRTYDNLIAYNTITLTVHEVQRVDQNPQGMFARIKDNLIRNCLTIGKGIENGFVGFVSALPYLLLAAVVLLLAFLIVRKCLRKRKKQSQCAVKKDDTDL